jgi:diguanylate cyclase (GGDEF)-like protein
MVAEMNSQVMPTYAEDTYAHEADYAEDPVSGLIGRDGFESRARTRLGMHLHAASALTLVEIDHMDAIGDRYGSACADMIVRGVAQLLLNEVRGHDVVGRIDATSFAILHTEIDLSAVRAVGQRLRLAVQSMRFFAEDGTAIPVTVSVGIDGIMRSASRMVPDLQNVLARAADRVAKARAAGCNRVVAF